ncbi:MAG TPA: sortase [Candidatus Saccharimonadales bacterium]|nr:sortase [Candidatus Saccharimonadales bacterium]
MDDKPSNTDAFLPLPNSQDESGSGSGSQNPAANLIRQKVQAAYSSEPDAANEILEAQKAASGAQLSKHQKFIYSLTSSGKPLAEIQEKWHDYYANLSDVEKHQVWQEFYAAKAVESESPAITSSVLEPAVSNKASIAEHRQLSQGTNYPKAATFNWPTVGELRQHVKSTLPKPKIPKPPRSVRSLFFGLSMGAAVILILLFSFFNERFIAPFIQPSRSLSNVPLISTNAVGSNPEVIIPKINVEIPVIYGLNTIDEKAIEDSLNNGVVHYADTALPGQNGNVVIVGHSSNNILNPGHYKFAFVLLNRLEPGDTFYLQKDGKRYTYQVYQKKIVDPTDISVLGPTDKPATASLITCDPPGTSLHRLVVTAEQISPDPTTNTPQTSNNTLAIQSKVIPGNSQSLWSRFWDWMGR